MHCGRGADVAVVEVVIEWAGAAGLGLAFAGDDDAVDDGDDAGDGAVAVAVAAVVGVIGKSGRDQEEKWEWRAGAD